MWPLSKKMVFAIQAVVDIAYNAGPEPVQSKEITRRQGIPQRYLEQVMQKLVRAGVLKGVRGPRGGYRLARERRRISFGDIARVVSAVDSENYPDEVRDGSEIANKVIAPLCTEIRDEMIARLDRVTIEEICKRARDQGIASALRERLDYTI